MATGAGKLLGGIAIMVIGVLVVFFGHNLIQGLLDHPPVRLWMAGAGALGLVGGLITGLSDKEGSGTAFMTFIGTGLLVPILGGVAALLGNTETVTEKSTYDNNSHVVERTTETISSLSDNLMHPLAVLGSFFLAFGVLAILGIIGGALLKKGGLSISLHGR